MSQLFRKEALKRRSRALYGEVRLRTPLRGVWILLITALAFALMAFILFGIPVGESPDGNGPDSHGTVWSWLRG